MRLSVLLCLVILTGCATAKKPVSDPPPVAATSASALVFDVRLSGGDLPDLSRDIRQPAAYVGFEDLQTTYYYLRVDDRQRTDGDRYERQSYIQSLSVRYR